MAKPWLEPGPKRRPKVIWKSSIPYGWTRAAERWEQVQREAKEKQDQGPLNLRELARSRPRKVRVSADSGAVAEDSTVYYSVKYLGITNGEIGILTQRKPIPLPVTPQKQKAQHRPSSESLFEQRTKEEATGTFEDEDALAPDPDKYNEFVVNKYWKARPLTAGKRQEGETKASFQQRPLEGNSSALGLHYITPQFQPARRQRRGVSGWKLSRPHSSAALTRPARPVFAPKETPMPALPPTLSGYPEAYLSYLMHKTRSQSHLS